jgi:hypothetical protein
MELLIIFIAVLFLGISLIRKFVSSNSDDSFFLGSLDAGVVSLTASMTATWIAQHPLSPCPVGLPSSDQPHPGICFFQASA